MIPLDTNVPTLNTFGFRDLGQMYVIAMPSPPPPA